MISVWLNRPEVHNAMNALMIEELTDAYSSFDDDQTRAIVLRGKGKSFCAGADLNYMKGIASFGIEENKEDSLKLAGLFQQHLYLSVSNYCGGTWFRFWRCQWFAGSM